MTPIKIAVGYVRCSTDMQDDSIDQQKRAIEIWAKGNGYTIIEWFEDEGKSGTSFDKRPAFMRMVKRVEVSPNFEHVLVYDESRWGRAGNPRESTYWKMHLERQGVKVRVVNSQSRNENDIGSFVTEVVESAEASEYSKKLSRSTMRGCQARVQEGYSSGGSAPYGYKRVAVSCTTREFLRDLPEGVHRRKGEELVGLEPGDPCEMVVVRRIFEMGAAGIGRKSIANTLNDESVPCPRRGKWRNKDQKWSGGTVRSILMNPVYYGAKVYNRHPKNKLSGLPRGKRNPSDQWITREAAHTPIVPKELFTRANGPRRSMFGTGSSRSVESPYLLSGLIKCSHCGFNYNGFTRRDKNLRYYADSGYISKGKSVCDWHAIPKDHLEGFVIDSIGEIVTDSAVPARLEGLIERYLVSANNGETLQGHSLDRRIAECEERLRNLLSLVEKGIDLDTILPRIKEVEREIKMLRTEGERSKRIEVNKQQVRNAAQEAAKFILGFEKNLKSSPVREQKFLIRQFVKGIVVDRGNNRVSCSINKLPRINNPILSSILKNGVDLSLKGVPGTHKMNHS